MLSECQFVYSFLCSIPRRHRGTIPINWIYQLHSSGSLLILLIHHGHLHPLCAWSLNLAFRPIASVTVKRPANYLPWFSFTLQHPFREHANVCGMSIPIYGMTTIILTHVWTIPVILFMHPALHLGLCKTTRTITFPWLTAVLKFCGWTSTFFRTPAIGCVVSIRRVAQHHRRQAQILTQAQEEVVLIGGLTLFWIGELSEPCRSFRFFGELI